MNLLGKEIALTSSGLVCFSFRLDMEFGVVGTVKVSFPAFAHQRFIIIGKER